MFELILILATLALDQLVKLLAMLKLPLLEASTYPLWPNVFHLTYVKNTGAAFGMLSGQRWLFVLLAALVCTALIIYLVKTRKKYPLIARAALSLIISGAIGNNIIDRLAFGYVRDLFDFRLINFAVFNVADSCIVIGVILVFIYLLFINEEFRVIHRKRAPKADGHTDETTV